MGAEEMNEKRSEYLEERLLLPIIENTWSKRKLPVGHILKLLETAQCPFCNNSGEVPWNVDEEGNILSTEPCEWCAGKERVINFLKDGNTIN